MIPVFICKATKTIVIKHDKIHVYEAFLLTTTKKGDKMRAVGNGFDIALTHKDLFSISNSYKIRHRTFMRDRSTIRNFLKSTDLNEFIRKNDNERMESVYKKLKSSILLSNSNLDKLFKDLERLTYDKKADVLNLQDAFFITRLTEDQEELKRYYKATKTRIKKYESKVSDTEDNVDKYLSYLHDLGKKRVFEYLFNLLEVTV